MLLLPAIAVALAAAPAVLGPMSLASADELLCADAPLPVVEAPASVEVAPSPAPPHPAVPDWCVPGGRFDGNPLCSPDPADRPWHRTPQGEPSKAPVGLALAPSIPPPPATASLPAGAGVGPATLAPARLDRPPKPTFV